VHEKKRESVALRDREIQKLCRLLSLGRVWKELLRRTPESAGSTETPACCPIAASTFTSWPRSRPSRNHLPALERHTAQPAGAARVSSQLALARSLDQRIIDLLRSFPKSATPMEVLRTAVSALSFYDADEKDNSHDANVRKAYNLTAQIAMIVAIYDRIRKGKEIVPPGPSLSHAEIFYGC
jgi:hypothetical protein